MNTYFLYNSNLLIVATFSYLGEYLAGKEARLISRFIVFLALFLVAAFRYDVGTDYLAYVRMFDDIAYLKSKEYGWYMLNSLVHLLSLSVQWVFVFAALLIYTPLCFALPRKYYSLFLPFFVLFCNYFQSFNAIRQYIAISFVIWALLRLNNKKYLSAVILFCISYSFHRSVVICVPFFFFASTLKIKNKILPTVVFLFGVIVLYKINLLDIAFRMLSLIGSGYARYVNYSIVNASTNSGLGVMVRLIPVIMTIVLYHKICITYPKKRYLVNGSLLYSLIYIVSAQYFLFGRIRTAFYFIPLFSMGYMLSCTGKYRKVILLFLIGLNLILFEKQIIRDNRDVDLTNKLYPYYSIFDKGR